MEVREIRRRFAQQLGVADDGAPITDAERIARLEVQVAELTAVVARHEATKVTAQDIASGLAEAFREVRSQRGLS